MTIERCLLSIRPAARNLSLLGLSFLAGPLLGSCATQSSGQVVPAAHAAATISHDVFFTFTDANDADVAGLIAACEGLREIPGVVHLTAGPRDVAQTREVNETSFHVALHVEFADQAAYDGYGPHPVHQALVTEFVPKTSAIVVYDALISQ